MVMYFKSDKARNYLLNNGFVYTFRKRDRWSLGKTNLVINRKDEPFAIGNVEFIEKIHFDALKILNKYHPESGFNNLDEWIKEILTLNKLADIPDYGNVYKVKLIKVL